MKIDKCEKLEFNQYDKKYYVTHIRALKQTLNHGLLWNIENGKKNGITN